MAEKSPDEIRRIFWKKMEESPFMMIGLMSDDQHSVPLTAQLDEDQVDTIFFFASRDNRLAQGGMAMAQFVSKGHDFFACLMGEIRQTDDRAMIDKLWSSPVEAWFPGGKDDPNLALYRFEIDSAEMWEADMSLAGRVKMLFGGKIRPEEEGSHTVVETTAG